MTNGKLESVKIKNKKANGYHYIWLLILIVKEKLDMFPHRHEDDFVNLNLLYIYPKEDDKYLY